MLRQDGKSLRRSQYRLLGLVGQGQFGHVYCAMHRQTGRLVALKNLDQQRFPTHKFLRELRFLLSLQHPNIVTCQAIEHSRTGRYLVMDYCEGGTLRGLMESESRLHPFHCLQLAIDILEGLDHAHRRGIVHCDIKPENILLSIEAKGWMARISDFGIARLHQELAEPQSGSNTGAPAYMAPERFYGQYAPASDLYSVGILLFELLSGDRPFSGTPNELQAAHLNQPLTFPEQIPQPWRPILATALQKLAGRRYRTAAEMLAAVRQLKDAQGEAGIGISGPVPSLEPAATPVLLVPDPQPPTPITADRRLTLPAQVYLLASMLSGPDASLMPLEIYSANEGQIVRHVVGLLGEEQNQSTEIAAPVVALHQCDRGCLAVTADAVHLLFRSPMQGLSTHPIAPLTENSLVAATGRWVAIAQPASDTSVGKLEILPLWGGGGRQIIARSPDQRALQTLQLFWLDTRHLVVIDGLDSRVESNRQPLHRKRSQLTIFNRRGKCLFCFKVPLQLNKAAPALLPHRLLAMDWSEPYSLLLIDLMPYRIRRIGLEIRPHCFTATPWGVVVANQQGTMILLDHQGRRLQKFECGLTINEITVIDARCLGIATQGKQPEIHLFDLTQLDLTQLEPGIML